MKKLIIIVSILLALFISCGVQTPTLPAEANVPTMIIGGTEIVSIEPSASILGKTIIVSKSLEGDASNVLLGIADYITEDATISFFWQSDTWGPEENHRKVIRRLYKDSVPGFYPFNPLAENNFSPYPIHILESPPYEDTIPAVYNVTQRIPYFFISIKNGGPAAPETLFIIGYEGGGISDAETYCSEVDFTLPSPVDTVWIPITFENSGPDVEGTELQWKSLYGRNTIFYFVIEGQEDPDTPGQLDEGWTFKVIRKDFF